MGTRQQQEPQILHAVAGSAAQLLQLAVTVACSILDTFSCEMFQLWCNECDGKGCMCGVTIYR